MGEGSNDRGARNERVRKKHTASGCSAKPYLWPWQRSSTLDETHPSVVRMAQNLEELFDVVDEQDQVTGRQVRREVHAQGLRHRAVHLLVVNTAGDIFLQKRSKTKDLFPGIWDSSAAGHVGAGEDYDGTALRELEEELGLKVAEGRGIEASHPQIKRLFKIEARAETGQEFVWVYRVESEGPFVLQADEIECGDWFSPAAIDRWIERQPQELAPAFLFIWPMARAML